MKLLIIDTETTGLDINSDSVVEIGAALVDTDTNEIDLVFNKVIRDKFWDVNKHKDAWIFGNSGLTVKEVEEAQPLETYFDELQELFETYNTVAFNLKFDYKFLTRNGFKFNKTKCLMEAVKDYVTFENEKGRAVYPSVEEVYNHFFIGEGENKYVEQHRAGSDAIDEARIMLHMTKLKADPNYIKKVVPKTAKTREKPVFNNTKKYGVIDVDTKFPFGKHKGVIFSELVKKDKRYLKWCVEKIDTLNLSESAKLLLVD